MEQRPIGLPAYLSVIPQDDGRYRMRLISTFGPLQPTSVLSFSALVDTLRAWRGPVRTDSPLVGRLVAMTHCTLVVPSGPCRAN